MSGGRRPAVAWVTAEDPHFTRSGGRIRQAHLLTALARRADVHLLLYGRLADPSVRAACRTVTELPARAPSEPGPWRRRLVNLWRCLPGAAPHEVSESRPARRALRRALRGLDPDVVCVEHIGLAPLIPPRTARRARWALTLHYLSSTTMRQWAATATSPQQRFTRRREAAHARRVEARAVREYDAVFTVCAPDAAQLPGPSVVVPNGVAVESFAPTPLPRDPRVLFVGRLDFLPNVDGVQWFADEVWPLVRAARPDAELVLVGREPAEGIRRLARRPGVSLHADAPDVRPHLQAARLCVVPLRLGSGTRLKVLEALAAARPVAGTSVGLAGLDLTEREAATADDAPGLARCVVNLLADDGRAAGMAQAGRRLVRARYGWQRVAAGFVDSVLGPVAGPAAHPTERRISSWAATELAQS